MYTRYINMASRLTWGRFQYVAERRGQQKTRDGRIARVFELGLTSACVGGMISTEGNGRERAMKQRRRNVRAYARQSAPPQTLPFAVPTTSAVLRHTPYRLLLLLYSRALARASPANNACDTEYGYRLMPVVAHNNF